MNRTQIEQEVKNLEAQLEEKRKQLEAMPKRWRAKVNGIYYYISSIFEVNQEDEDNIDWDHTLFNACNYFKTFEEAEAMAEKTKLMFEMTARVKELNGDWVANWGDGNEVKLGLVLGKNKCYINKFIYDNIYIFGLSVQSQEHAKILLNEFKERIERWY